MRLIMIRVIENREPTDDPPPPVVRDKPSLLVFPYPHFRPGVLRFSQ